MLDEADREILKKRESGFNKKDGPRVGDFIFLKGEKSPRRFTHVWNDYIQTTIPGYPDSFYLGGNRGKGWVGFSGMLSDPIDKSTLLNSGQTRLGKVWFFHHNHAKAYNGVEAELEFRVFVQS